MRYKMAKWAEKVEQDGKLLWIWSDYPYWSVTNRAATDVFKMLREGCTIEDVANRFSGTDLEMKIQKFLEPFLNAGVVFPEGKPPMLFDVNNDDWFADHVKITNLVLNFTNACNLRCAHCYNRSPRPDPNELTVDELKGFLREAWPLMNPTRPLLGALGGEPLIRSDDLLEVFRYARHVGYRCGISTNGTLLTTDFAKSCCDAGISLQVSIDGVTPETHERLRGPGTFDRAVRAARILGEVGGTTAINMCYHKGNISELPQYPDLAESLGVPTARFIPLKQMGRAKEAAIGPVFFDEMVQRMVPSLMFRRDRQKRCEDSALSALMALIRLRPKYRYCGTGLSCILLDSQGDIYPCPTLMLPEFKAGNIREESFEKIFHESPVFKRLRRLSVDSMNRQCSRCHTRYFCGGGCRGETLHVTGDVEGPDYRCSAIRRAHKQLMWTLVEDPDFFREWAEYAKSEIPNDMIFQSTVGW